VKAGFASMGVAALAMVICLVLAEGFGTPLLPTLITGGVIGWLAMVWIMIRLGLAARRDHDGPAG
jgi:hypothetical protein